MSADPRHTLAANSLRALAIDATNAADSGHPGAPMGLADIAVVLWTEFLRFDPNDPKWPNRDRFVLSNGHASMLIYGLLHLAGYDLPIEELKRFRQLGSKTPGHPEYGITPGVETTTGPLGQGFANGVGFALAARMAKARFPAAGGFTPIDHYVYGICGDGCLMEGVSAEAASLAGHLGLGEIIYVYDDNSVTIDGRTPIAFSENVQQRFEAYGWHTLRIDGHDPAEIRAALEAGKKETARPTLILAKTEIGFGSPNRAGTPKAHGEALGEKEAVLTKEKLGWTYAPFEIPEDARALFRAAAERGKAAHAAWKTGLARWKQAAPEAGRLWEASLAQKAPKDLHPVLLAAVPEAKAATRGLSSKAIQGLAQALPWLIGGSADLAASNKTLISGSGHVSKEDASGRNIHFGVREHAMGAIVNGLALYGMFVPFGATFLTFSDYMRPALRLAALMKIRALTVFTHDSIYLGEDGPTHQAVEHLWALRLIPGLCVWRPADAVETALAWGYAAAEGPSRPHALVFTRQDLPVLTRPAGFVPETVQRGGYVLSEANGAKLTLVATGSEVGLAVEAAALLGQPVRIVSMPCVEVFLEQDAAYQAQVLPKGGRFVTLEVGRTPPWHALVGRDALCIGIDSFGESAPIKDLQQHFRLTAAAVAERIRVWL